MSVVQLMLVTGYFWVASNLSEISTVIPVISFRSLISQMPSLLQDGLSMRLVVVVGWF